MKLKKLVLMALIGCSIVALSACSAKKHYNQAGVMEEGGAETSGIGENENFVGAGEMGGANAERKNTFYFDYDRSSVRDEDKPRIYANANFLIANSSKKVIIEGHTDPRGSREYNIALAERRANAVAELLVSKGVNPGQIRIVSYGAERLAAPGRTEQDFQLDRRAIIVYVQK